MQLENSKVSHINLSAIPIVDIPSAMVHGIEFLCSLYQKTGVHKSGIYKKQDNQVGLGILGLSNLLAIENVSYKDFLQSLRKVNLGIKILAFVLLTIFQVGEIKF